MEETAETRSAGAEDIANGASEPQAEEAAAPEVAVEEEDEEPPRSATAKQEEVKAALGAVGSRPFTMRDLLGELKEDSEASAAGGSARSAFGEGSGVGSADAEGSPYRFVGIRVLLVRHFRSHSYVLDHCDLVRYLGTLGF
jgi:membrane protein involved in colicin uptake